MSYLYNIDSVHNTFMLLDVPQGIYHM